MDSYAKKAVILAAGVGRRLFPVTKNIPKPLVELGGKKMIESIIEALIKQGIFQIFVVTGYLREQFNYLPRKYSRVDLVLLDNPFYADCNNISSLYIAREHLGDCIICDGDMLVHNSEIFSPAFEHSGYCSMWAEETDEWLQHLDPAGFVTSCSRNGGRAGWQLFSVSFWTEEDGEKLKAHLEEMFNVRKIRDVFWDDIPLFYYKDCYKLKIREIKQGDLIEIDSICELDEWRKIYENK